LLLSLGRLQQDRRDEELSRDLQQAKFGFEREMLTKRIKAEQEKRGALEQIREETGAFDPPIVGVLSKRIEADLGILRDPNTALTLGLEEVDVIKNRVRSNQAEIRRQSGREYYVDPSLIRIAPKPTEAPPPLAAPPVKPAERRVRVGREIRPRLAPPEIPPEPLSAEEIAARRAGIKALQPPQPVDIPEGARSVLTDKGWIYTVDEKVWISAETGEPVTGQ